MLRINEFLKIKNTKNQDWIQIQNIKLKIRAFNFTNLATLSTIRLYRIKG